MAEKFFPFNAIEVDGRPDRIYTAEDFAEFFGLFVGNGVYPNPSTNLQVLSLNNNMVLTVKMGSAMINGYGYQMIEEDMKIQVNTADNSYNRKDIVVVALDLVDRNIKVKYKPGIPSSNPQEPELIRTSDVHELKLASILIRSGTQQILQSDITDTRLNKSVCGLVTNVVQTVDATTLFNQYQDYLNQKIQEWNQTKEQQGNNWQQQMQDQEQSYEQQKQTINAWYESVKADIATLKTFVFDNWLELPGAKYTSTKSSTGVWTTTIIVAGKKVAEKIEHPKNSAGKFVTTIKVYERDGVGVLKQVTSTEYKNPSGQWIIDVV